MSTPLITTMQASWLLNEASGNRVDPINSNTMVPTGGVTQGTGHVGGGFDVVLDGTGYLSAADSASLKCGPIDWTVSGWFNLTNPAQSGQQWIVSKRVFGGAAEFDVSVASGGLIIEIFNGAESTTVLLLNPTPGITVTTGWHYLELRHVAAAKEVTVFYDTLAVTRPYTGTITNSTAPFQLGCVNSGNGRMTGSLQAWGKWNRALTNQESYYLYAKGAGKLYPFSDWTGSVPLWNTPKVIVAGGFLAIGTDPDPNIGTNTSITTQASFTAAYAAFNVRPVWANSIAGFVSGGESTNRLTNPVKVQSTQFADTGASAIAEPLNGRSTLTLDVGQMGVGDDIGTDLAQGQLVRVRTLATLAAAGTMPATTPNDWQVYNANHLADATNVNNGRDGVGHFSPFAMIGQLPTDSGLVACANRGDSIGPRYVPILASSGCPYLNLSNSGEGLVDIMVPGGDSTRTAFAAYVDVISNNYGVNDLRKGQNATQMIASEIAFCRNQAAKGVRRFIRYTLTPIPGFSTSDRNTFNAQILAWNSTTFSAAIGYPVDYRPFSANSILETAPGSNVWVNGMTDDQIHPNETAGAAMLSLLTAPVVAAILAPLPGPVPFARYPRVG